MEIQHLFEKEHVELINDKDDAVVAKECSDYHLVNKDNVIIKLI